MHGRGSQSATPFLLCSLAALAFAGSVGLTDLIGHLEYLIPIYGLALLCALITLNPTQPLRSFDRLVLGVLALILLNPLWSVWPAVSWWTSITVALLPLVLLATRNLEVTTRLWNRTESLIYTIGSFVCAWISLEFITGDGRRSDGPLLDYNAAGALMYLLLLPLLGRYLSTRQPSARLQTGQLALIAVLSFALFATASRGAIGVFVITAVPLFLSVAIQNRGVSCRFHRLTLASAAIAGAFVLHIAMSDALESRNITNLSSDTSTQARLLMWESTLEMYAERPWLGSGLGSFTLLYPSVRSPTETASTGDLAHNDYLQAFAEGGPLLLAALLLFIGWIILILYRLFFFSQLQDESTRWQALGYALALAATLIHATVNFIFYVPPVVVLISLWAGRLRLLTTRRWRASRGNVTLLKTSTARITLAIGIFGLAILIVNVYSAKRFSPTALADSDYTTDSGRYQEALLVSRFVPFDYLSILYLIRAETREAIEWSETDVGRMWADMARSDIELLRKKKYYDCVADETEAVLWHVFDGHFMEPSSEVSPLVLLDKATDRNPQCRSLYTTAGQIALDTGRYSAGISIMEKMLQWLNLGAKDIAPTIFALEMLANLYLKSGQFARAEYYASLVLANDRSREKAQAIAREAQKQLAIAIDQKNS